MMKRTPKSECIRKIEQDRSILKILTFGQNLHKSQLFFFFGELDVCTIFEPRMKKWVPKSECTRKIEWDRSVLKFLTFWSWSKVYLVNVFSFTLFFFFFFKAVRTGSDFRVGLSWTWTNGSAVDDVIHDVIVLERVARVEDDVIHDVIGHVRHVRALAVLIGAWDWRPRRRIFWRRVHGLLGLKFLGFVDLRPYKVLWSVL